MSHKYTIDIPTPTDNDRFKPVSSFTPPISIGIGEEGCENLEAKVKEKTDEIVKADEKWTPLDCRRTIDTSIVAGFMFQSGAGSGCWIQVTENGKRPSRILIDREQDFGMYLVVVLRHEEWTTSGEFYLRFLRRVPVLNKRCTARTEGPFAGPVPSPSDSDTSIIGGIDLSTAEATEKEDNANRRVAAWIQSISSSPPPQSPSPVSSDGAHVALLVRQSETSEDDEDATDDEDYLEIGAAALRGSGGGIVPSGVFPSTE